MGIQAEDGSLASVPGRLGWLTHAKTKARFLHLGLNSPSSLNGALETEFTSAGAQGFPIPRLRAWWTANSETHRFRNRMSLCAQTLRIAGCNLLPPGCCPLALLPPIPKALYS